MSLYFQLFMVECNEQFLQSTKHKHMLVELWHKSNTSDEPEKMVGIAKLPLHQFYIAFHEKTLMNHVMKQKVCVNQ